jgi:thiosulfate/3-mercaptopyruvate sulfurtransferase
MDHGPDIAQDIPADLPDVDSGPGANQCLACHSDPERIASDLEKSPYIGCPDIEGEGECCGGSVPDVPLEEKVLVTIAFVGDTVHGAIPCQDCHGGNPLATSRIDAHDGLVPDPSADGAQACRPCHDSIVDRVVRSGHYTLSGKRSATAIRAGTSPDAMPEALATSFNTHCNRCHATCGDCHVSVPDDAGGGLLNGHEFAKAPPVHLTCLGCHGTRVRDEYYGRNAGRFADVHWFPNRMSCLDCHSGDHLHGSVSGDRADTVALAPACTDCHSDNDSFRSVPAHEPHRDGEGHLTLSCQVCHAQEYKHCFECHVAIDSEKRPTYSVNPPDHVSMIAFRIGRNAEVDARHREKWVTVRHVPADPDTHSFNGEGLLPEFDAAPTWRRASPHTIRRNTDQTAGTPEDCAASCHGRRDRFLDPAELREYEVEANRDVVVPDPPGPSKKSL